MLISKIRKLPYFKAYIIEHLSETGSTNDNLKHYINSQCYLPCLQIAKQQTAGRGQYERKWESADEKSLLFSFTANFSGFDFPPSLIASIALASSLQELGAGINGLWLKWPNDIWYKSKKLAGILTESISINAISRCVIGVGINMEPHSEDFAYGAVSDFSQKIRKDDILYEFCRVWGELQCLAKEKHVALWEQHANIFWNQRYKVKYLNDEFIAVPERICEDGALIVKDLNQNTHRLLSGSLTPLFSAFDAS